MNGLRPVERGHVYFRTEKDLTNAPPKEMIDQGVGYIPEDRMRMSGWQRVCRLPKIFC